MTYYRLEPEVAGGIGERTVLDRSGHRLKAASLDYEFDDWLGDDLLAGSPVFVATRRLADDIKRKKLTGVSLARMETSRSITFETLNPGRQLPEFIWLKIDGKAGADDFGIADDGSLIVSARALAALKSFNLNYCDIAPYPTTAR
jgi:hypothetical protein